eukprot:TRINITY_DN3463_c0_g1_i6.p1 TRINITY_DN3463_c0_g1~~TRINITY_DN3463_c0_g1_i6.p1  ORF type:complete len:329 (-),score=-0.24 TRINITY_DN3463_c0_g1_i6:402-1388(-)
MRQVIAWLCIQLPNKKTSLKFHLQHLANFSSSTSVQQLQAASCEKRFQKPATKFTFRASGLNIRDIPSYTNLQLVATLRPAPHFKGANNVFPLVHGKFFLFITKLLVPLLGEGTPIVVERHPLLASDDEIDDTYVNNEQKSISATQSFQNNYRQNKQQDWRLQMPTDQLKSKSFFARYSHVNQQYNQNQHQEWTIQTQPGISLNAFVTTNFKTLHHSLDNYYPNSSFYPGSNYQFIVQRLTSQLFQYDAQNVQVEEVWEEYKSLNLNNWTLSDEKNGLLQSSQTQQGNIQDEKLLACCMQLNPLPVETRKEDKNQCKVKFLNNTDERF